ncbi:MAG: hypothetical protein JWO05_65 [Gemmatimonadetes bacterium]|nr:hypothetical protein [Gemmatimonadota bacterium]
MRHRLVLPFVLLLAACGHDAGAPVAPVVADPADTPAADTRLVFTSLATGGSALWSVRPDGSDPIRLSPTGLGGDIFSAVSPSGSRIAFANGTSLWTMNSDGSDRRVVTTAAARVGFPEWSRDERTLYFYSTVEQKVWKLHLASGALALLDTMTLDEQSPSLSPDETRLAFSSQKASGPGSGLVELHLMRVDGTELRRISVSAPGVSMGDDGAAWSPDGSKLLFARTVGGEPSNIWVMNADGSGLRMLIPGTEDDMDPTWSPDGHWIAFARFVGGRRDIFVAKADGSSARNVTKSIGSDDQFPRWGKIR